MEGGIEKERESVSELAANDQCGSEDAAGVSKHQGKTHPPQWAKSTFPSWPRPPPPHLVVVVLVVHVLNDVIGSVHRRLDLSVQLVTDAAVLLRLHG